MVTVNSGENQLLVNLASMSSLPKFLKNDDVKIEGTPIQSSRAPFDQAEGLDLVEEVAKDIEF